MSSVGSFHSALADLVEPDGNTASPHDETDFSLRSIEATADIAKAEKSSTHVSVEEWLEQSENIHLLERVYLYLNQHYTPQSVQDSQHALGSVLSSISPGSPAVNSHLIVTVGATEDTRKPLGTEPTQDETHIPHNVQKSNTAAIPGHPAKVDSFRRPVHSEPLDTRKTPLEPLKRSISQASLSSAKSKNALSEFNELCQRHNIKPDWMFSTAPGPRFHAKVVFGDHSLATRRPTSSKREAKLALASEGISLLRMSTSQKPTSQRTDSVLKLNYVGRLQEFCVAYSWGLPVYHFTRSATGLPYKASVTIIDRTTPSSPATRIFTGPPQATEREAKFAAAKEAVIAAIDPLIPNHPYDKPIVKSNINKSNGVSTLNTPTQPAQLPQSSKPKFVPSSLGPAAGQSSTTGANTTPVNPLQIPSPLQPQPPPPQPQTTQQPGPTLQQSQTISQQRPASTIPPPDPLSPSATSRLLTLATVLNLGCPEYVLTSADNGSPTLWNCSVCFKSERAFYGALPFAPGERFARVESVFGKARAKEEAARLALGVLDAEKKRREEMFREGGDDELVG